MNIKFTPETRRAIIEYGSKENLNFNEASEHLINEGIKALNSSVFKSVSKAV